jgi:hypothetical protein
VVPAFAMMSAGVPNPGVRRRIAAPFDGGAAILVGPVR